MKIFSVCCVTGGLEQFIKVLEQLFAKLCGDDGHQDVERTLREKLSAIEKTIGPLLKVVRGMKEVLPWPGSDVEQAEQKFHKS